LNIDNKISPLSMALQRLIGLAAVARSKVTFLMQST